MMTSQIQNPLQAKANLKSHVSKKPFNSCSYRWTEPSSTFKRTRNGSPADLSTQGPKLRPQEIPAKWLRTAQVLSVSKRKGVGGIHIALKCAKTSE